MLSIVFCLPLFLTGCSLNNKEKEVYYINDEWSYNGTYDYTGYVKRQGVLSEENEQDIKNDIFHNLSVIDKQDEYETYPPDYREFYIENNKFFYKNGSEWSNRNLKKLSDNAYKIEVGKSGDYKARDYLIKMVENDGSVNYVIVKIINEQDSQTKPGIFVSIYSFTKDK